MCWHTSNPITRLYQGPGSKFCNIGHEALSEAAPSKRKIKKAAVRKVATKKKEDKKASRRHPVSRPMEGRNQKEKASRDSKFHFLYFALFSLEDYLNSLLIMNLMYPWKFTGFLMLLPAYDGVSSSTHTGLAMVSNASLQSGTGPSFIRLLPYMLCMYGLSIPVKVINGSRSNT